MSTTAPTPTTNSRGQTELPKLFKRTSTGKMQVWMIKVDGNEIITTFGQVGGKKQTDREVIAQGKNIGRANETTPAQQALLEAQSDWDRKVKAKNYNPDWDEACAGKAYGAMVAGGIEPMLAHTWEKRGKNITFPAAAQPKLDGHRCIAIVDADGSVTLWSRTRKVITGVPHISAAIASFGLPAGTVLDGELYHHDYRDRFAELTSFIRQATPKDGHEVVQYHVYDLPSLASAPFEDRLALLRTYAADRHDAVVLVETIEVADYAEALDHFGRYRQLGYEGLMLRNVASPYVEKRSADLIKVKEMQDAEFEIVDVVEGKGRLAGCGIFVCATDAGVRFNVKMAGPLESLRPFWTNPADYIGRQLTVQFQDMTTDANNVPRFPVALRFREDV